METLLDKKDKAIIFDIDGTAIDSPGQKLPSERLIKAIRSIEDSYFLCAATGRVWTFARSVLSGLSLTDPCIISSGTQICDPDSGEIFWQCDIDKYDIEAVVDVMKKYPEFKVLYNDFAENDYLNGGIAPTELAINGSVYFIEQIFVPENIAPEIVAELTKIEGIACTMVVAQRVGFKDLHVTNRLATKEQSIAELLRILGVDRKDTIGVGDGHNDVHLFKAVAYKVAMGNSVDELKDAADEVVGSVKKEGFSAFLERLASGEGTPKSSQS